VHCEPVGTGLGALKYLAPYIFRVAISNNRILKLENDRVTFRYRDTETGAERFLHIGRRRIHPRFYRHVLPKGFVKVRYYGLVQSRPCESHSPLSGRQLQETPPLLLLSRITWTTIPHSLARKQNLLHLLTSCDVPFAAIPCCPARSFRPLDFRLHETQGGEQMVLLWIPDAMNPPIVLLASFCQLAKNTIHKFNLETYLIARLAFHDVFR